MSFEFLADVIDGSLHVAVVKKGVLQDLYIDPPPPRAMAWASIYLGKVVKLDKKLNAAIVDLGDGNMGFLPEKHMTEPLGAGQMITVQIKSEGKRASPYDSHKLPRLTMKLYLPGFFLAFSPNGGKISVSRKLNEKDMTEAMAALQGEPGGWIIEPSSTVADGADITREARYLQQVVWQKVLSTKEARLGKPGPLRNGPNALFRALFDYGMPNIEHVHVATKELLDLITQWSAAFWPDFATSKRLRLFRPEKPGQKLFDIYDVYSELEAMRGAQVFLNDGGTVVIEHTAAMTVVDVNQGSAANIVEVNMSAAREMARQMKIRNLSGAIVIDFINMEYREDRARLLALLESLFTIDSAATQVHGFTRLGMIELTRKRRTATVLEKLKK